MGNDSVLLFSQSNKIPQCFCSFWGPKTHLQHTVYQRTAAGNLWLNSQTEGTTGVTVVTCDHRGSLQTWLAEDDAALMPEYCCLTPSFNTRGKGNETGTMLYLHSFVQCIQRKAQHMWPHIQPLSQTSICDWRLSGGGMQELLILANITYDVNQLRIRMHVSGPAIADS